MDVKRNIILSATATSAENTISKVDKQISSIGSGFDKKFSGIANVLTGAFSKIGTTVTAVLGTALTAVGAIAATIGGGVVAAFAGLSAFMLKFSGQLTAIEGQFDAIFAERKDADAAINDLMSKYDYTKSQTQKFLAQMGSKISNVVSQGQLMKVSKDAVTAAQRISSQFGISLEQAMDSVAMALQGNVRGLKRYGIQVDQVLSATGKMSQILAETAKYEKTVETTKNTVRWQIDNIKNTILEKMQQVAQMLDPILAPLLKTFNNYLSSIDMSWMPTAQAYIENFINAVTTQIKAAKPYFDIVVNFFNKLNFKLLGSSTWKETWERFKLLVLEVKAILDDLQKSVREALTPAVKELWVQIKAVLNYVWDIIKDVTKTQDAIQLFAKTLALLAEALKYLAGTVAINIEAANYLREVIFSVGKFYLSLKSGFGIFKAKENFNKMQKEIEDANKRATDVMADLFVFMEKTVTGAGRIFREDYTKKFKVDPETKDATDMASKAGQKVVNAIADGANKAAENAARDASNVDFDYLKDYVWVGDLMKKMNPTLTSSEERIISFGNATVEVAKKVETLATSASETIDKAKEKMGQDVNVQLDEAVHKLQTNDYSSILVETRDVIFTAITGLSNMFTEQVNEQKRTNEYLQNGVSFLKDISSNLVGVNAFA